jgi:O-antigen ligase
MFLAAGLALLSFLVAVLEQMDVIDGFGIRALLSLLAAIGLLALVLGGEGSQRKLLFLGLATITVGHRSIHVGARSIFVALDIVLWVLFIVVVVKRAFAVEKRELGIPLLLFFVTLWGLALATISCLRTGEWDDVLAWTSPLIVGLPAFLVVRHLIRTRDHLNSVLLVLMAVSLSMSILAILEYRFPSVETTLPWIFSGKAILSQDGFVRAPFSYFGYPAAATFVVWGMLISYSYLFRLKNRLYQLGAIVVFTIGGVAVYISGQRSSWLGLGLALIILNIPFGIRGVGGVAIIWGVVTQLSNQFWSRVETLAVYAQRGVVADGSTQQRINRASWAWDTIVDKPLAGGGYGHWLAHNVFLEIGSTIGLIPALAFVAFIGQLVFRVIATTLGAGSPEQRRYGWLFLSLTAVWILQMSVETVLQTPAFAAAHWTMMAVAWNLRDICAETSPAQEPAVNGSVRTRDLIHDYSLSPNLQLRSND